MAPGLPTPSCAAKRPVPVPFPTVDEFPEFITISPSILEADGVAKLHIITLLLPVVKPPVETLPINVLYCPVVRALPADDPTQVL